MEARREVLELKIQDGSEDYRVEGLLGLLSLTRRNVERMYDVRRDPEMAN